MKKIFVTLLVVALVLLCLPFVLGFEIESRYRGLLNRFEEAGYQLESHDYQRGFFVSEARSRLVLPLNDITGETEGLPFTLVSHIQHGPYNPELGWFGDLTRFSTEIEVEDKPLFTDEANASIETRVKFSGDGITHMDFSALQQPVALKQGMQLEFAGMQGQMQFDAGMERLQLNMHSDGLQILTPKGGRLDFGAMRIEADSHKGIEDLMLGTTSIQLQRIAVTDPESQVNLDITDTRASATTGTSSTDGNVDMRVVYSIKQMQVAEQNFGPAIMQIDLSSLSAAALARVQESMQEMRQNKVAPQQQGMAVMGVLMSVLPAVLEQNPGIAISQFELGTPQGKVVLDLTLQADGMTMADISSPQQVLNKLQGKASMRIPESIVRLLMANSVRQQLVISLAQSDQEIDQEALEQQVEQLVDAQIEAVLGQQLIERDGLDLVSAASLKAGLLSVNGKTVPLPQMQQ